MVTHKALVYETVRFGVPATVTTTLCGRMNKQCPDGNNAEDNDDLVTCKFCRKLLNLPAPKPIEPAQVEPGDGLPPLPNPYRQDPPVYSMIAPQQRDKWKKKWAAMDDEECKREHYKHYEWECRKTFEELEAREAQLAASLQSFNDLRAADGESLLEIMEVAALHEAELKASLQRERELVDLLKEVQSQAGGYGWGHFGLYRGKTIVISESQLERINAAVTGG